MNIRFSSTAVTLFAALLPALAVAQPAQPSADRLETLEARLQALEARSSSITADASGLSIRTPDFSFQFRGLLQADGRWFTGDAVPTEADTFVLRRLRPTFQGTVGSFVGYRLTPEFAGSGATIVDAWIDLNLAPWATLRTGKQKGPVGLERLQGGGATAFIERGLPTELAPNREIGTQLQGSVLGGRLLYVAGVYNGTVDGGDAGATDNDGRKELALRLFYQPVEGIGFGVAGTTGNKRGFAPRNYQTVDRRPATALAAGTAYDGRATRLSPQGYVYRGPFGLLGEYITSRQELVNGATEESVTHSAWQLVGSYVLTGEKASYAGVRPDQPYRPGQAGWGAVELVARIGALDLDGDAAGFGFVAANAVESVSNAGVGLNWYLTRNLKVAANYNRTSFSNYSGPDRDTEHSIFTRLQVAF
jgi:phosphate-selective porin OprO/OprP